MPDDFLTIHLEDLRRVEAAVTLRHDSRDDETRRAARMRRFAAAAAELGRTLSTYATHALVHSQGTAGATDFARDTDAVGTALMSFADQLFLVARDQRARLRLDDGAMRPAAPIWARQGGDGREAR